MFSNSISFSKKILICLIAEILNVLSVLFFYNTLHIPLFFDTIFTVAVVFYLGLVPALFVSVGYNLINSIAWYVKQGSFDPFVFLYAFCGIAIVISTWFIARRKDEFKISLSITILYLLLIALISSFFSVVIGGVIDYFHLKYQNVPDMMNPIKNFINAFLQLKFSMISSCIVAQIPISFTDRLIATFAGYGVYKLTSIVLEGR